MDSCHTPVSASIWKSIYSNRNGTGAFSPDVSSRNIRNFLMSPTRHFEVHLRKIPVGHFEEFAEYFGTLGLPCLNHLHCYNPIRQK